MNPWTLLVVSGYLSGIVFKFCGCDFVSIQLYAWTDIYVQTISGRPPPAASMAVGQFFNPEDGQRKFSPGLSVHTIYAEEVCLNN